MRAGDATWEVHSWDSEQTPHSYAVMVFACRADAARDAARFMAGQTWPGQRLAQIREGVYAPPPEKPLQPFPLAVSPFPLIVMASPRLTTRRRKAERAAP